MRVLKFGGTSVGSAERINHVLDLVSREEEAVVVLSAVSGTTNQLQELANDLYLKDTDGFTTKLDKLKQSYYVLISELFTTPGYEGKARTFTEDVFRKLLLYGYAFFSKNEENEVLSLGEILSTNIATLRAQELGLDIELLDALNLMRLDDAGEPDVAYTTRRFNDVRNASPNKLFITQGYICRDSKGKVSNLQRGGSDYTAALIAEAISADEVQIWTDIDGMHNNDPRLVEHTDAISELSYNEASELAYFGAKVLHPQCVFPAQRAGIPMRIRYTMDPKAPGTLIHSDISGSGVKAIAAKDGITVLKIRSSRMLMSYGFLRQVFEVFENHRTPIDMITTSEVAVSLTIDQDTHLDRIVEDLSGLGEIEVENNQSIVCLVGDLIADSQGYITQIFSAMDVVPVRMVSYGGSRHNISILIHESDKQRTLNTLHETLFTVEA